MNMNGAASNNIPIFTLVSLSVAPCSFNEVCFTNHYLMLILYIAFNGFGEIELKLLRFLSFPGFKDTVRKMMKERKGS